MQILIVDDDTINRKTLQHALDAEGYNISEAKNGKEAIQQVHENPPDLILLDMQMPEMDGLETLTLIKNDSSTSAIPVIIVTSLSMDSTVAICLDNGAEDFIVKPISPLVLRARIRGLMRRIDTISKSKSNLDSRGRLLGFVGSKGGVGTTSICVNLATELARSGSKVAILELNNESNSAAHQLGLPLRTTDLMPFSRNENPGSEMSFYYATHETGLRLLTCPQATPKEMMSPERACELVSMSQEQFDYTVIDLASCTNVTSLSVMPLCHSMSLVVELEPTSIDAAKIREKIIFDSGIDECRTKVLVVNRACVSSPVTLKDVRASLSSPVFGVVPAAPDAFMMANAQQIPITIGQPNTMAAGALSTIATRFQGNKTAANCSSDSML